MPVYEGHYLRFEVTVEACIATPEDRAMGDNIADATLGFAVAVKSPGRALSDVEINAVLAAKMGPVLAVITAGLTQIGLASVGQLDSRMGERATPTGQFGKTSPVTVRVSMPLGPDAPA